ncbi:MAG: hypothetical protein Ct9H300mP9_2390 [Candidatus Neomarinimicrobiota bacterium]|nr:MAG: hypothetical protein Ct9H300mP9_2390 [Candidatus Neomarinimicrobiota bacterium]
MDFDKKTISFFNEISKEKTYLRADCVIGTDGSASVLRDSMEAMEDHEAEYLPLGQVIRNYLFYQVIVETKNLGNHRLFIFGLEETIC